MESSNHINGLRQYQWLSGGLTAVFLIFLLDCSTGHEISVSVIYLIPIGLLTWYLGRNAGIALSLISVLALTISELRSGYRYSHVLIHFWNSLVVSLFYFSFVIVLSRLRDSLEVERTFSRTDNLTGLLNLKGFAEAAEMEIERSRRYGHPFTLIFIDCDNFKIVNDNLGHQEGNALLRELGDALKNNLRVTDIVARFGGDEFLVLLPETGDRDALGIMNKLEAKLVETARGDGWSLTFSMGLATFLEPLDSLDEMIKKADNLMYEVKAAGKNAVRQEVFSAGSRAEG